jgi:hypothetical protein
LVGLEEGVHRLGGSTRVVRHRIAGVGRVCPPEDLCEKVIAGRDRPGQGGLCGRDRGAMPVQLADQRAPRGCPMCAQHVDRPPRVHRTFVHGTPVQPA